MNADAMIAAAHAYVAATPAYKRDQITNELSPYNLGSSDLERLRAAIAAYLQAESGRHGGAADSPIEAVTPAMIDAGVYALHEFGFTADHREIVESVYMAMEYERLGARREREAAS